MAINFKPFEELFAPEYQLTYISIDGYIDVGPNTYSVFHFFTMTERQQIFQVCEKHLPWKYTLEQEQWERTMYMYQFIIKSPPPFSYPEYKPIMVKQEVLVNSYSDLYGSSEIIVEYNDITMTIFKFIIKAANRLGKVGVKLVKNAIKLDNAVSQKNWDFIVPNNLKIIKSEIDNSLEFESGLKVVFYSGAIENGDNLKRK